MLNDRPSVTIAVHLTATRTTRTARANRRTQAAPAKIVCAWLAP